MRPRSSSATIFGRMPSGSSDNLLARDGGEWDAAPCGLLILDEGDRVRSANARFLDLIGSSSGDVAGKSFWNDLVATSTRVVYLTQLAPVLELDGELVEVMVDLRTADGGRMPALLNARRMTDASGRRAGTRIAMIKVQDRRLYENDLRRARREAEQAREEAEHARSADAEARRRMEFLAEANTALAGSAEVQAMLDRLAQVLVLDFADWCVVYTRNVSDAQAVEWSSAHRDPQRQPTLDELVARLPSAASPRSAFRRVLEDGVPTRLEEVSAQQCREAIDDDDLLAQLIALDAGSALVAPSYARAEQVATMVVVREAGRPRFTAHDLTDLTDIAARTGVVIDNLRRSAREHSNSVALQRAVLTVPPTTAGIQIATRYVPATSGNDIGGDWYDAFVQPDGTLVLVIGDVVGHDIYAAAAMGQLRGLIRTVGYITGALPADILSRSDEAARGLSVEVLATVLVARVELSGGDTATLHWSNAGHPPPVLLTAGGGRVLEAAPGRPLGLGVRLGRARTDHQVVLGRGDVLLLYTDGLVERPQEAFDVGLARLVATLERARGMDLESLCDLVLTEHAGGTRDDIALLAVRLGS